MNLLNDMEKLTGVPEKILTKLSSAVMFSILQTVEETIAKKESYCEIDLGIGELLLSLEDDELKFKFLPSDTLSENLLETIEKGKNPMEEIIYSNIISTLEKTYKELL